MKQRTQHTFKELCSFLRAVKANTIYLIHEPYREKETRKFSNRLKKEGFIPLVASDFRKGGKLKVREAINKSDFSIVVAFDSETVETAKKLGVKFFDMREEE